MQELYVKPVDENNRPQLAKMCKEAFAYEQEILSPSIWPEEGFDNDFLETLKDPQMEGWGIYDADTLVAGAVILPKKDRNILELFFVDVTRHGKGYGTRAWKAIEKQYPQIKVWETFTPLNLKNNLAFYVNKCGFHIIEISKEMEEWDAIFEKRIEQ